MEIGLSDEVLGLGCFAITTVFSHAQTVVMCGSCSQVLCQPTGGKARLTEGMAYLGTAARTRVIELFTSPLQAAHSAERTEALPVTVFRWFPSLCRFHIHCICIFLNITISLRNSCRYIYSYSALDLKGYGFVHLEEFPSISSYAFCLCGARSWSPNHAARNDRPSSLGPTHSSPQ